MAMIAKSNLVPGQTPSIRARRMSLCNITKKIGRFTSKDAKEINNAKRRRGGVTALAKILPPPPGDYSRLRTGYSIKEGKKVQWKQLNLFVRIMETKSKDGKRIEIRENGMRARVFHDGKNTQTGKFEILRGKNACCERFSDLKVGDRIFVNCFRPVNEKFQDDELVIIKDVVPKWRRMKKEDSTVDDDDSDKLDNDLASKYGNMSIGGDGDGLWVWDAYNRRPKINWEMDSYVEKVMPVPTQQDIFEKFSRFSVQNQLFNIKQTFDPHNDDKHDIVCAINMYPDGQEDPLTQEFIHFAGFDSLTGEWSYEPPQQTEKKNASMVAKFSQDSIVDGKMTGSTVFVKFSGYSEFVEEQYALGDTETWKALASQLVYGCPAYLCCQGPGNQQEQFESSIRGTVESDIDDECDGDGEKPGWRAVHVRINCGAVDLATGIRTGRVDGRRIATQLTWEQVEEACGNFKRQDITTEVNDMQKRRRLCGPSQPDVITISEIMLDHKEYMYQEYDFFVMTGNNSYETLRAIIDDIKTRNSVTQWVIYAVHKRTRIVPVNAICAPPSDVKKMDLEPTTVDKTKTAAKTKPDDAEQSKAVHSVRAAPKGKHTKKRKHTSSNTNASGSAKKQKKKATSFDDSDSG